MYLQYCYICFILDGPSTSKKSKLDNEQQHLAAKQDTTKDRSGVTSDASGSGSRLTNGSAASGLKTANGSRGASGSKLAKPSQSESKAKSIQDDPNATKAYKALFTTSEACKRQPKAHWVTHNPLFY